MNRDSEYLEQKPTPSDNLMGFQMLWCHLRPQNLCTTWPMSVDRKRDIEVTKPSRIDLTVIIKWL